jgi:short-subunit dehydrogenase
MNHSRFKDQIVWITGASSGIGEALAQRFSRLGARLILSARREQELKRVAGLCAEASSVFILPLDMSNPGAMSGAARSVLDREGAVDVMVHNAGVGQRALAADTAYEVDEIIMRTNFLGPIALTKALLPSMKSRKKGHFIVVSSVLGKLGLPGRSAYCASKHALHGFFDTLRAEVSSDNIDVTLVLPGWVRTNVSINALSGNGAPHGKNDSGTATGFPADVCAERIITAAEQRKPEVNVVRLRERAALHAGRFTPALFRRLINGRGV